MLSRHGREISVAAAILAIFAALAVAAPGFFASGNQLDMVLANVPVLIIGLGMTMVILTGHIDISVGSQFAICSVTAGSLAKSGVPLPFAIAGACCIGAILGAINGALVSYVQIPSIVVTLAAMVAFRDALRWATEGAWVQDLPAGFQWFGLPQSGGAFVTIAVAAILALMLAWSLRNVAAGRAIYATGSDSGVARLMGIHAERVTFWVFVVTGVLTGCAAVLNSIRFNQIPSNAGLGLELKVIAAVVVGGAAITGGRGTIIGTVLGVILLGVIGPALTFLGVSPYWERSAQGAIILAAVAIDAIRLRSGKRA
jgi:rhamnose transport system permease protein